MSSLTIPATIQVEHNWELRLEEFEDGQLIVRQGARGDRFYVILDGAVAVLRIAGDGHAEQLAMLGPGDYFGEAALVENVPRTATVVAGPDAITPAAYFLRIAKESVVCQSGQPLVARQVTVDQVHPGETFSLPSWMGRRLVSFSLVASDGEIESSHGSRELYPE